MLKMNEKFGIHNEKDVTFDPTEKKMLEEGVIDSGLPILVNV